ncbi:MAG: oxidoreductase [Oscillospiraceae bacterium]|nr:oxidoreductase [Oscillospiraceae bacterium]
MKQTSRIISTHSADVFGVCSALFELGGMTIMHDASGCNSTYTTHDEPRWYDMESMVYISGLSEMEAIMGDDEKLIGDIVAAAEDLKPKFIAVAGTPIPTMTGFDFGAVAELIEQRTGIPAFGFSTTGMNTYVHGASLALEAIARRFADRDAVKTRMPSANILGLTPLDFTVNGSDSAIAQFLEEAGFTVLSRWAMGSTLEDLAQAGSAHVNLVVSATGLAAAKALQETFGTPYVVGVPMGADYSALVRSALKTAAATGENQFPVCSLTGGDTVIIGEGVTSLSLASALELSCGKPVRVICPTECDSGILRTKDIPVTCEEEIDEAIKGAACIIADPLFKPICPEGAKFVRLPAENFSGRIWREEIPNLITHFEDFAKEVL